MLRKTKIISLLLVLSVLCGCQRYLTQSTKEEYQDDVINNILSRIEDAKPVEIYNDFVVYKKQISMIFEGFADEKTMMELADYISENDIKTTMFISGEDIINHPDVIKYIADRGIAIGNYGLTGETNFELSSDEKIARQIYKSNEYITNAGGKQPNYFLVNRSEYTETMLRVCDVLDMDAVIKPSIYLNYKSFISLDKAEEYTRNKLRGDIVSFKLDGELDSTEVVSKSEELIQPAVDKQPTIVDEKEVILEEKDSDEITILDNVRWFVEGCEINNVELLSIKELHSVATAPITEFEIPDELLVKLDATLYEKPVTDEPFGIQKGSKVSDSYFDDVVFIGDSVMQGIQEYVQNKRRTEPNYFGKAQFLDVGGMSVRNALWEVSDESRHPTVDGVMMSLEDAVATNENARKVYIMLGANDILLTDTEKFLENYQNVIQLIKEKSPQVEFYIMSVTPGTYHDDIEPKNSDVFERNLALIEWSAKYGYEYLDLAHFIRDEDGNLPTEWCVDADNKGRHFNELAIEVTAEFLYTHTKKD